MKNKLISTFLLAHFLEKQVLLKTLKIRIHNQPQQLKGMTAVLWETISLQKFWGKSLLKNCWDLAGSPVCEIS